MKIEDLCLMPGYALNKNGHVMAEIKEYKVVKACSICGEKTTDGRTSVCEKCIATIKWARERMEENND